MNRQVADQLASALREARRSLNIAIEYSGRMESPTALRDCLPEIDAALHAYDNSTATAILDATSSLDPNGQNGVMPLPVGLHFAEHPRPQDTMAAPADTEVELRSALAALAAAYRLGQRAVPGPGKQLREWFNLLVHAGLDARDEGAPKTVYRIQGIARQVSAAIRVAEAGAPVANNAGDALRAGGNNS